MKACILSEGGYPVTVGGLSEWAHILVKNLSQVDFDVFCMTIPGKETPRYAEWPNILSTTIVPFSSSVAGKRCHLPREVSTRVAESLQNTLWGTPMDVETLHEATARYGLNKAWLLSKSYWNSVVDYYSKQKIEEPFVTYYWTILGLYAALFDVLGAIDRMPQSDVYHPLSVGYAGLCGSFAKVKYGRPLVITEQGLYLVERAREMATKADFSLWHKKQIMRFSQSVVKTSYKYADRVVPPSHKHMQAELHLGLPLQKIHLIDNGIECDHFIPGPPRNGGPPVVGCFARVVPIKGIEVLIKAARRVLQTQQASFVVVGEVQDEGYYQECLRLVQELGIGDHFRFLGHKDPLEWYHQVDVFTLSSISEGVPYALLEAMSCGLPSVCTAVGGVPEIIQDGLGYLVPPNQPDLLAEKLGLLISDRSLRSEIGHRAVAQARTKYHIRDMASRFYSLYQEVCHGQ